MDNSETVQAHYNIISIDPKTLLSGGKVVSDGETGNYKIEFRFDFRDMAFSKKQLISSIDRYGSNALFYQMEKTVAAQNGESAEADEDLLLQSLVFIDFTEIFKPNAFGEMFEDTHAEKKTTFKKEELEKASHDLLMLQLFDPENGFTVVFDDDTEEGHAVQFVPFDKSASMSRDCRISFVDKSIKDELDKRLLLDLDEGFRNINMKLSKYYAYRGLYLTDAHRIEANEQLHFDEETVIVIGDDFNDVRLVKKGTSDSEKNNMFGDPEIKKPDENGVVWKLREYAIEAERVNSFDGEGLISPKYAALINKQLGSAGHSGAYSAETGLYEKEASSFQIRMPFTKGMLHAVDYNAFFDEYVSEATPLYIRDYYGIERNIRKAQIILTESMFKCCKWLRSIWESSHGECSAENDPMKYFFDKMKEYEHSLYVGNTDIVLGTADRTKMNYQFLSTLDMSGESFEEVVNEHVEQIRNIKSDMLHRWETDNELDMSGEELMDVSAPWLKALKINDAFSKNPKIRNLIEGTKDTMIRDCGTGRLSVAGECRFISCDLLELLIIIAKRLHESGSSECIHTEKLDGLEGLYANKFYMPKPRISLFSKKVYAFFRNPHLSRNEQCALCPFIPPEGNVYQKYFSHLSGVVMVSRDSLAPMILSGADYDGDLVKIIADKRIVDAVLSATYEKTGSKEYERRLPIVNIPNTKELSNDRRDTGSVPYDTIKNTFSNEIGMISNLAICASKKEYVEHNEEYSNLCAACTVVTGLEIDAAKTGVHPSKNIEEIREKLKKEKSGKKSEDKKKTKDSLPQDYFISAKNALDALPRNRKAQVGDADKKTGDIKISVSSEKKARLTVHSYGKEAAVSNIDRLPYYFAKTLESAPEVKEENAAEGDTRKQRELFNFQLTDTQWKKHLDAQKQEKTKEVIRAYRKILNTASEINKYRQKYSNTKYSACAFFILSVQYDELNATISDFAEGVSCSPRQALDRAYLFLNQQLKTGEDVQNALKRLMECQWHLTAKEDREKRLAEVISCTDTIPSEAAAVLCNFSNSGYKLLYYVLKDIIGDELKDMTPEKLAKYKESIDEQDQEPDSELFKKLYSVYCDMANKNASKKVWQGKLVKECRAKLKAIFENDMDEALKYVYSCRKDDSSFTFFWDVLPGDVILRNVHFVRTGGDGIVE